MRLFLPKKYLIAAIMGIAILGLAQTKIVLSQEPSLEELRKEIQAKNEELKKLEEEAQKYREEIAEHQERGRTLKAELSRIERIIEQLRRDIAVTEKTLQRTELEIEALAIEIREKEESLQKFRFGLAELLRLLAERRQDSLVAILLKNRLLSDFFQQFDYFGNLEKKILNSLDLIRELQKNLAEKKAIAEKKKKAEENLKQILDGRHKALAIEKRDRIIILQTTQNEEKRYQKLLKEQEAKIAALADEIREIEEKIQITIDPQSLPAKGSGVLAWPLPQIKLSPCLSLKELSNCITQFFGYTSFAFIGGYGGKGHNGIDFRASLGTPVFSAEDGTVEGVGDTDIGCQGASYGKWILIRHNNNLSTLYAHLASIEVSPGQKVERGERIGLSGRSGYATGPHLHFSVFASPAVRISSLRSRVCGRLMTLPLAALNGYLNPLDYL